LIIKIINIINIFLMIININIMINLFYPLIILSQLYVHISLYIILINHSNIMISYSMTNKLIIMIIHNIIMPSITCCSHNEC